MIINQLNFYLYNQPFKSPIVTPKIKLNSRKSLVIELIDNQGNAYFGECNAFKTDWYDNETIDSVKKHIKEWYIRIKDKEISTFKEWQASLASLDDYPAARCTVMMAIYQKYFKLKSFKVPYGATVSGMSNKQIDYLAQTQPKRIKLKYSGQLKSDIDCLQSLNFNFDLALDANESINVAQYQLIKENTEQNILYIEEPFQFLDDLKYIHNKPNPPIAIDEKATTIRDIKDIIAKYPVDTVILKPFRLGGIDRVFDAIQLLHKEGVKVVIGGMYEYGLSRYFTAMLAQYGDYPGDVTPAGYYFENDYVENEGILKEGMIEFTPPAVKRTKLLYINDDCD